MSEFYTQLSYSFGNEDWRTEKKALQIEPDNHIVCITASGDRPLNLLANSCARVTSVDTNPIQNHLLELKRAAMKHLDFYSYIEFLGLTNNQKKKMLPRSIYESLSEDAKLYWVRNMKKIEQGIIYQGELEKMCINTAKITRLLRGRKMSTLTSFTNIEDQQAFIAKWWDRPFWKNAFKLLLNPKFSKYYIDDPGLTEYVAPNINPGEYIYERLTRNLNTYLAKENPLFSLVFNGMVVKEGYTPYLMQEYCTHIKPQLDKLVIYTKNMIAFLEEQPDDSIDRFSFSDIASYMDEKSFNRMLRAAIRCAKPKARFCIRQFLSDHKIDADLVKHLAREPHLEKQLESEDRCFVYRFMTGEIKK